MTIERETGEERLIARGFIKTNEMEYTRHYGCNVIRYIWVDDLNKFMMCSDTIRHNIPQPDWNLKQLEDFSEYAQALSSVARLMWLSGTFDIADGRE